MLTTGADNRVKVNEIVEETYNKRKPVLPIFKEISLFEGNLLKMCLTFDNGIGHFDVSRKGYSRVGWAGSNAPILAAGRTRAADARSTQIADQPAKVINEKKHEVKEPLYCLVEVLEFFLEVSEHI